MYDTLWTIKPWIKSIDWGIVSQYINILAVPVERVKTQCSDAHCQFESHGSCEICQQFVFFNRVSIPISKEYAT